MRPFSFFVKVICACDTSLLPLDVPESVRTRLPELVPWRTEANLYRSDVGDRLPEGLAMPRAVAVRELDGTSTALWLEKVPARPVRWDVGRHIRAAYLLGRFAASPAVAPVVTGVHAARIPRMYADSWIGHVALPALADEEVWAHPLIRDAFDAGLRDRMLAVVDALPALLEELDDVPWASAHGDACTANLLVADDRDALLLVDFGFCGRAPLGTDLGQLLLGEVQAGQRPAADLSALEAACLPAYVAGVRAEGGTVGTPTLRRIHAALMTVFSALPAIPVEHLHEEPTPQLRRICHARAAIARFAIDLLGHTDHVGVRSGRSA